MPPVVYKEGSMDPVQEQVDAFNTRDVDRFLAAYDPDAVIEDGAGNVMMRGHEAMRGFYGPPFDQSPNLHVRIANRIQVGEYVIDEEYITGMNVPGFPPEAHGAAIYRVVDDKIVHVRLIMG